MDIKTIKKQAAEAAKYKNHTETKAFGGDFERTLPPVMESKARFIEYVEFGEQPRKPYKGAARDPKAQCRLTFELLSKKNLHEVGEGKDKQTVADRISVTMNVSDYETAKFHEVFEQMRYGRDNILHMAQILGEGFLIDVEHNPDKNDAKKIYANVGRIKAPVKQDDETEETIAVEIPAALSTLRLFLFDSPTVEQWDSIHIDGTRTVKDAKGNEEEVSKNWMQEKVLSAVNFEGSPLAELLEEAGENIAALLEEEEVEAPEPKKAVKAVPAAKVAPVKTSTVTKPKATGKEALAQLGLSGKKK